MIEAQLKRLVKPRIGKSRVTTIEALAYFEICN